MDSQNCSKGQQAKKEAACTIHAYAPIITCVVPLTRGIEWMLLSGLCKLRHRQILCHVTHSFSVTVVEWSQCELVHQSDGGSAERGEKQPPEQKWASGLVRTTISPDRWQSGLAGWTPAAGVETWSKLDHVSFRLGTWKATWKATWKNVYTFVATLSLSL